MVNKDSLRVAIAYIVNDQDGLLMGKRNDNGLWTVPAGKIEQGECPFIGMARELKEETGLDAKDIKLVKAGFVEDMLLYLFHIEIDSEQEIDTSEDPDEECDTWAYEDPLDHADELHVPLSRNWAVKHWAEN